MCDPATLLAGGLSALGGLLGMTQSQPAPPQAAMPVLPDQDRAPGATVRLGAGKEDKTTDGVAGPVLGFTERRASGTSLTRGRSGLAI